MSQKNFFLWLQLRIEKCFDFAKAFENGKGSLGIRAEKKTHTWIQDQTAFRNSGSRQGFDSLQKKIKHFLKHNFRIHINGSGRSNSLNRMHDNEPAAGRGQLVVNSRVRKSLNIIENMRPAGRKFSSPEIPEYH